MNQPVSNTYQLDDFSAAGFAYAAGVGRMPKFTENIEIDAFDIGIRLHREQHPTSVTQVFSVKRQLNSSRDHSDKELATTWGQL